MRFIDASVFLHAYIKPKRSLKPHEKKIRENAKKIITRVNGGEEVTITVVHLSEIANILEDFLSLDTALELESGILSRENIEITNVSADDYMTTIPIASDNKIGLNDALASLIMKNEGITEIYSFDKDFDKVESVKRITK